MADRIKQQLVNQEQNKVKLKTEVILALTSTRAAEIVDYAQQQNVDLVVVRTRERSGFKRLLSESVVLAVVTMHIVLY